MKIRQLILVILLIVGIVSCKNNEANQSNLTTGVNDSIEICTFSYSGKLTGTHTSILLIEDLHEKVEYLYREKSLPDTLNNFLIVKYFQSDSLFTFFNDTCIFIGKRKYEHLDKMIEVKKYLLKTDIADNQTAFYFIDDYGLILLKSIDWGNYLTFDRGLGFEHGIIMKIMGDTTDFFN